MPMPPTRKNRPLAIGQVIAVVNDDVITRHELDERLKTVVRRLKKQGTPLPDHAALEKQVLEGMINGLLLSAGSQGKRRARGRRAAGPAAALPSPSKTTCHRWNNSAPGSRRKARTTGDSARKLRGQMISSAAARTRGGQQAAGQRQRGCQLPCRGIRPARPRRGVSRGAHSGVHSRSGQRRKCSGQPEARQRGAGPVAQGRQLCPGGGRPFRCARCPAGRRPRLACHGTSFLSAFREVLAKMQPGETSPLLHAPNAYHILKLLDRRRQTETVIITQTHVRHILIKTSDLVPDSEARSRITRNQEKHRKWRQFCRAGQAALRGRQRRARRRPGLGVAGRTGAGI